MRFIGRLILCAVLLFLTVALVSAATYLPGFFLLYPSLSKKAAVFLSGVTASFPFPVWQALAVLGLLLLVYSLVRCFAKKKGFLRWIAGVAVCLCALTLAFTALWGLNHWAPELEDRLGLSTDNITVSELTETTSYFASEANRLAAAVPRAADGTMVVDTKEAAKAAGKAFAPLAVLNPLFEGSQDPVKLLLAPELFSSCGTTGLYLSLTGEACVNPDTYPASLPYTMCHEVAHRLTVAGEEEANFCAFLACQASSDPVFQYSGVYSSFVFCYNALTAADPAAAEALWDSLSEQVREDVLRASEYYAAYEGPVQDAAQQVNDAYLKLCNEEEGIDSYGQVTDLLVGWYRGRS